MDALALAMRDLGWTASVNAAYDSLAIAESPSLASPVLRNGRYVWAGYWAVKPVTMACRLDDFLREGGKVPGQMPVVEGWTLSTNEMETVLKGGSMSSMAQSIADDIDKRIAASFTDEE